MTTTAASIALVFGDATIKVEADEPRLLQRLSAYFGSFVQPDAGAAPLATLELYQGETELPEREFQPWDGRGKDSFADLGAGHRLVFKNRTGVLIEIDGKRWRMRGNLTRNISQVINAAGALYGLSLADRGCTMVHSSYVARDGRGLAVVAQSGMGKSSVAVRLLEHGFDFVSNDRLLLEPRADGGATGHGLPKLPRVNPGTLLSGDRTRALLDPAARKRYEALSREELWAVEDKYDLDVKGMLGRRWLLSAPLSCALVLDWRHGGGAITLQRLSPGQAVETFRSTLKTFGVFDLHLAERTDAALIETARRVPVFRVGGGADPNQLAKLIADRELEPLAGLV
jgi:HprK-related kinase B